ncbi:MAG: ZIP family metal transporter [Nanoarchaeota archaeon]|nr:ZIP family metal transporter [Nanoarchaeota archaeon]
MALNYIAYAFLSVLIVSLVSLIGVLTIAIKAKNLNKWLFFLISFSAGALFGGAFLHLIPEAFHEYGHSVSISLFVLVGILTFFVMEKFIHWRHCHVQTTKKHPHPLGIMNLIGDAFHNFIDGLLIGGSYIASIPLGISTTIAVILHEIPQEIGDFGVLIYAGYSRKKALIFNFITALTAFLGVALAFLLHSIIPNITQFVLPFTAGGFIYIAGSDLIPELKKSHELSKSFLQLFGLALGISIMLLFTH